MMSVCFNHFVDLLVDVQIVKKWIFSASFCFESILIFRRHVREVPRSSFKATYRSASFSFSPRKRVVLVLVLLTNVVRKNKNKMEKKRCWNFTGCFVLLRFRFYLFPLPIEGFEGRITDQAVSRDFRLLDVSHKAAVLLCQVRLTYVRLGQVGLD